MKISSYDEMRSYLTLNSHLYKERNINYIDFYSWEIDGKTVESVRLYFSGLQNHCRWDCSHEIKRRLLLGRKVMTNLDSIFKSRDITLPTKVHLVKAMVFPVVTYGCATIKKAEPRRIDAFEL